MMRNDPAEDAIDRPWAVASGILLAQLGVSRGVLVVNDPFSLANAINKTYFQHFPEDVRPRTLISRDHGELAEFVKEVGGSAVLKPLQGSGGASVFKVSSGEAANLNQMLEAISRDGYIVAQEYLTEASQGRRAGVRHERRPVAGQARKYAAFRRAQHGLPTCGRTCTSAARRKRVKVTDDMLGVARRCGRS